MFLNKADFDRLRLFDKEQYLNWAERFAQTIQKEVAAARASSLSSDETNITDASDESDNVRDPPP